MRIVVDLNRCQSYGQCVFAAPTVFEFRGEEALEYEAAPDEALRFDVERAAASCPVRAIRLEPAGIEPIRIEPIAVTPTAVAPIAVEPLEGEPLGIASAEGPRPIPPVRGRAADDGRAP